MLLVRSIRITHPTPQQVAGGASHSSSISARRAAARPAHEVRHGLLPMKLAMACATSRWPSRRCCAPLPLELVVFYVVETVEVLLRAPAHDARHVLCRGGRQGPAACPRPWCSPCSPPWRPSCRCCESLPMGPAMFFYDVEDIEAVEALLRAPAHGAHRALHRGGRRGAAACPCLRGSPCSTSRTSRRAFLLFPSRIWTWMRATEVATFPGLRRRRRLRSSPR